ncbi:sigma-70 family RNA polymerase sigma factor, partial [Neglectibacter timonensis]
HYGFLFFRCPTSFYNRPILINNCCSYIRKEKREVPAEFFEEEEAEESDLDTPLDVRETLSRLSQDDRLLLQLFYFEDLSVREISRILVLTPGTVRMRLTRGRKRFAEQYRAEVRYEKE